MTEREEVVAAVVSAAGGQVVGRVRLQKLVYLLEQLGLDSSFEFEYHHYGPYSRDLDNAIADAWAFDVVDEKFEHRVSDGARYSVFTMNKDAEVDDPAYGRLGRRGTEKLISRMNRYGSTVLELAATIHWLKVHEGLTNWKSELEIRKGWKVKGGRLDQAKKLLAEIHLPV